MHELAKERVNVPAREEIEHGGELPTGLEAPRQRRKGLNVRPFVECRPNQLLEGSQIGTIFPVPAEAVTSTRFATSTVTGTRPLKFSAWSVSVPNFNVDRLDRVWIDDR